MVKFQVLRVARSLKELDNPFLLLSIEQFLPMMVTIVVAATVQILIHRQAEASLVLAFHLLKQRLEAPRHTLWLTSSKETTSLLTYLYIRIDGRAPIAVVRNSTANHESQAFILLGTLFVKTQLVALRHVPKVTSSLFSVVRFHCRHISCKDSKKYGKYQISRLLFFHHYSCMLNVSATFNMPQTPMHKGLEACYVNRLNVFTQKSSSSSLLSFHFIITNNITLVFHPPSSSDVYDYHDTA